MPSRTSGPSSLNQDRLSGGASRLASLLVAYIYPICSLLAPRDAGAALRNPVLIQRGRTTSRLIAAFLALPTADRLLVCEAVVLLGLARIAVLTVPLRLMAPRLRRAPDRASTASHDSELTGRVRRAVTRAARHVPWDAVCLPQAIAAKAMLARRGIGSAFYLGATINTQGRIVAHAWLVSGGEIVTGAAGASAMARLARFG
jgi:hypothetical protein